jgi:DNA helicase-2/ATP-dependent DNA helicase PcrA
MVYMILNDLAEGIPPSEIIAFTFTEKAADELFSRVHLAAEQHLGEIDLAGLSIGTIHNWCFEFLLDQSDFYNFDPIDELYAEALVSRIYDQIELKEAYDFSFPRAVKPFLNDMDLFYNEHLALEDVPTEIREPVESYTELVQRNRLLPFGAMIRYATEYLDENGPLENISRLYVDEYQDVNPAQVSLIQNVLPDSGELVAVGDDMQCIYQWRGSDVERILDFESDFNDSTTFAMETNFRSRPEILSVANEISNNMQETDTQKRLSPDRDPTPADAVNWLSFDSEDTQATAIGDIVEQYVNNGVPQSDIAVLIRKHSFGRPIVTALESRGLNVDSPALRRGEDFIDEFVKPVIKWVSEKHHEPRNRIEKRELEQRVEEFERSVEPWIDDSMEEPLHVFWKAVKNWESLIENQANEAYNIRMQLYSLLDTCGIQIDRTDSDLMMGIAITSQIIRSVEEVHRRRLDADDRRPPRDMMKDLYFALDRNQDDFGEADEIDVPSTGVTVTSVHQAKGLEWPVVIIPSMNSGDFPVRPRSHGTSFPEEIADRYGTTVEDERRLFYVAATRAEDRLFLIDTSASSPEDRSPFINELKELVSDKLTTVDELASNVWNLDWESDNDDATPELVGLSDLLLYIECPYQYGLRRKANIEPVIGDELGYGEGLHELIQRRAESDSEWDDDELSQRVDEHVHLPYMSKHMEENSQKGIGDRLETLESLNVFENAAETELPVDVVFENGVVHGEIDYIEYSEEGVVVRDWKSNLNHQELFSRYDRQLQFYTHVLRSNDHEVIRSELVDVGGSDKAGQLKTREVDVSDQAIQNIVEQINDALEGIQDQRFDPTPSESVCSSCDMEQLCPYSQASEKEAGNIRDGI